MASRVEDPEHWARIQLCCVIGSRAQGLARDGSDTDRRGVYLAAPDRLWSLAGVPEQLEDKANEECYWELGKFLRMAAAANPSVLEVLWTPLVEHSTALGQRLRERRRIFLSKKVHATYCGYAEGQFRKLERDLRTRGEVRWKHAMHLVRVLLAGVGLLEDGELRVEVGEHRERLLAIRDGEVPWEDVDAWRLELHARMEAALEATSLPDEPDHEAIEALLLSARRQAARSPEVSSAAPDPPDPRLDSRLEAACAEHPYPVVWATVSGAHLYGFPSPDSDWDLRGMHRLPLDQLVGLRVGQETLDRSWEDGGVEMDLVTHDAGKFVAMMLKRNGYVLEQLTSPWVVRTSPWHDELLSLVPGCLTRNHAHHYRGFAHNQWGLFSKEDPPRVKPLLYLYRVLLTGLHLLRAGGVQADLTQLYPARKDLPFLPDLIQRKVEGVEKQTLDDAELEVHRGHFERLLDELGRAQAESALPEQPDDRTRAALDDWLLRLRGAG